MFEGLALKIITQGEGLLFLLWIGIAVAGFIVGYQIRKDSTLSMRRMPYLIWYGIIYCALSATAFAWLGMFAAIESGTLAILLLFICAGIFAAGLGLAVIGHARSTNAIGNGKDAWMAIVPIANLILFFKRPLNYAEDQKSITPLNILGVIFGIFLLMVAQGLEKVSTSMIEDMAEEVETNPDTLAMSAEAMLESQGLEATLTQMASEMEGQPIDEITTLIKVQAAGTTLQYIYEITADWEQLPPKMRTTNPESNCNNAGIRPILKAGASIEHIYKRSDGGTIGIIIVTPEDCGF